MVDTRFSVSIQILLTLAYHGEELSRSEMLAKAVKSHPTFIRKLVSRLVAGGLVQSVRGKGGGVKLAIDPQDITLKDIYLVALDEKPIICTHKNTVTKSCAVSCSMNDILKKLVYDMDANTQTHLEKTRLSDLLKKIS